MKKLIVGEEASKQAYDALVEISNAVGSTLGPSGCPALVDRHEPALGQIRASSTKDGVTVLGHIKYSDSVKHTVHGMCQGAAQHSVNSAGDGTTSTIVLAASLAKAVLEQKSKTPQAYGRRLKSYIDSCIEHVDDFKIVSDTDLFDVAKTSSNGDDEMAKIAAKVVANSAKYSNIIIAKDPGAKERYEVDSCPGYVCGRGYSRFRQLMITISPRANDTLYPVEVPDAAVVCVNANLTKFETIEKIVRSAKAEKLQNAKYLFILAFRIEESVAHDCMKLNRQADEYEGLPKIILSEIAMNGGMQGHGYQVLEDTAAFCGCKPYDPSLTCEDEHVGECGTLRIKGEETTVIGRSPNNRIKERCKENEELMSHAKVQYHRDIIAARNAELAEGLTTIIVGGGQMAEVQERADRLDDAVRAAQNIVDGGAVAGGGVIYARAGKAAGVPEEILEALKGVSRQVLANYGEGEELLSDEKLFDPKLSIWMGEDSYGFRDANECQVKDSAVAVKSVLKQALTLAVLVTTTRCISVDDRLKERDQLELLKATAMEGG